MKSKFIITSCLASLLCMSSCTEEIPKNKLEGMYVDEYKTSCLIICEYDEGKLGYYNYDLKKGIENSTWSFVAGRLYIKVNGTDSTATFADWRRTIKKASDAPLLFKCNTGIKSTPSAIYLNFDGKITTSFNKVEESDLTREIEDATKAFLKATEKKK